ncbi:alpha/beta hydrolase family protein [Acinetobacter sp. 1294596]|uniref:alpha/beta hydrolase n=1 Tax=Acinetobacter sp. 1294596 TaxID=1310603 RepID=UPI00044F2E6D|nr:alpha/beta hydrolase [Acinetobacter sp. 1294596]EXF57656.1 alpha/beta hydrolase family protein [Acinetobacter sp. 1294596]
MTVEIYPCKNHSVQTVVLSSGLGGHANFWQPQIEALREYFQIICYDHEGIEPQSPELPENYSIQHLAEHLAKILKQYQQQNCHFI